MSRRKRGGFTLIELMIVVAIIGVLASIAIPAFVDYVKRSKTSETSALLKGLFTGAAAYYEREGWSMGVEPAGTAAAATAACLVQAADTSYTASNTKRTVDWTAESQSFLDLNFSPADPVYFSYHILQADGMCGHVANSSTGIYTFQAHGDLDGDGTFSTFEVQCGTNGNNELYRTPGIFVANELE